MPGARLEATEHPMAATTSGHTRRREIPGVTRRNGIMSLSTTSTSLMMLHHHTLPLTSITMRIEELITVTTIRYPHMKQNESKSPTSRQTSLAPAGPLTPPVHSLPSRRNPKKRRSTARLQRRTRVAQVYQPATRTRIGIPLKSRSPSSAASSTPTH